MWAISLRGFIVMTSYSQRLNHTQTRTPTWPAIGHYMIKMRQLLSACPLEAIFSWSGNESLNDEEVHKHGSTLARGFLGHDPPGVYMYTF